MVTRFHPDSPAGRERSPRRFYGDPPPAFLELPPNRAELGDHPAQESEQGRENVIGVSPLLQAFQAGSVSLGAGA